MGTRALVRRSRALLVLACVAVAAGLLATGCGDESTASPSPGGSASGISTQAHAAAVAYFDEMAPIIESDYASYKAMERLMESAFAPSMLQELKKLDREQREVTARYAAIDPPAEFRSAHAKLVQLNQMSIKIGAILVQGIESRRPMEDWIPAIDKLVNEGDPIVRAFRTEIGAAAASTGVGVPSELLECYQPSDDSSV